MTKIYSYVLRVDRGAAPNPFWGTCTLTICKPTIRRNAQIGDWVIGTGSKNVKCNDVHNLSDRVVYAMKISDIKTLQDYDTFCKSSLPNKIPNWQATDWRLHMGDCIFDYSKGLNPSIRKSVHDERNRKRDLNGLNALLSDNFYYFGEKAKPLPPELKQLVKRNQGHIKIENADLVFKFEAWIKQFDKNIINSDPQMRSELDKQVTDDMMPKCAKQDFDEDDDETGVVATLLYPGAT
jgi:hypothetical protein